MTTSLLEKRKIISLAGSVIKSDGPKGEVLALVNTGYKDRQSDTLLPGCWSKCIREQQQPPIFWMHDVQQLPLGSVVGLQELRPGDSRIPTLDGKSGATVGGLLARIHFAVDTSRGHDAFILASQNHVKEWSVQIAVDPANEEIDRQGGRVVKEVHQLIECSMVVMGASLFTGTLESKSAFQRLQSSSGYLAKLVAKAAEDAEDRTWLALEEAERRAAEARHRKEAVREGLEVAAKSIRQQFERAKQVKELERMSNLAGNYFQAPPPRQLTAEEARIAEIRRMAGHI